MLKKIYIEPKADTPKIILDPENGEIYIEGKSFPPDVNEFYEEVLEWINEYLKIPNKKTDIHLKIEYFNTASSKILMDILFKFEDYHKEYGSVTVYWYYPDDDEDIRETGLEYAEIIKLPFNHIGYKFFEN